MAAEPDATEGRWKPSRWTRSWPGLERLHRPPNVAVVVRTVRLNHGQGRLHGMASFIKGYPRQSGPSLTPHICLPRRGVAGPRFVWRDPIGQCRCGARGFIHQVGTVVAESERTGVEQLMHGRKGGYGGEEVLFDFVEVRGGVEDDQTRHFTEMKRRFCGLLQRLSTCRETNAGNMAPAAASVSSTSDGTRRRGSPSHTKGRRSGAVRRAVARRQVLVSVQLPTRACKRTEVERSQRPQHTVREGP